VAVLWRFFDDREPEPIMGYRYINNLSKAKPIDHGAVHVLDVSPSVLSKGKPIDHGEVEVITPEIMPMMAARMIDHGAVSVLDVELNRIVEPEPEDLNAWVYQTHEDIRITNMSFGIYLYDDNGNLIEGRNTYTIIGAFKSDGTDVSTTYLKMRAGWNSGVSKYLAEVIVTGNVAVTLARVTYKIEE
jgi:hypothetical protein